MPDFAQVYNFLGSVFDPDKSGHLQRLKAMDPIDVETVCLLEGLLKKKYRLASSFHNYMSSCLNGTIFSSSVRLYELLQFPFASLGSSLGYGYCVRNSF
jgi:hypothetical protein